MMSKAERYMRNFEKKIEKGKLNLDDVLELYTRLDELLKKVGIVDDDGKRRIAE